MQGSVGAAGASTLCQEQVMANLLVSLYRRSIELHPPECKRKCKPVQRAPEGRPSQASLHLLPTVAPAVPGFVAFRETFVHGQTLFLPSSTCLQRPATVLANAHATLPP